MVLLALLLGFFLSICGWVHCTIVQVNIPEDEKLRCGKTELAVLHFEGVLARKPNIF